MRIETKIKFARGVIWACLAAFVLVRGWQSYSPHGENSVQAAISNMVLLAVILWHTYQWGRANGRLKCPECSEAGLK